MLGVHNSSKPVDPGPHPPELPPPAPQHDVVVTPGCNQAFFNVLLSLCDLQDRVVLFRWVYGGSMRADVGKHISFVGTGEGGRLAGCACCPARPGPLHLPFWAMGAATIHVVRRVACHVAVAKLPRGAGAGVSPQGCHGAAAAGSSAPPPTPAHLVTWCCVCALPGHALPRPRRPYYFDHLMAIQVTGCVYIWCGCVRACACRGGGGGVGERKLGGDGRTCARGLGLGFGGSGRTRSRSAHS